MAAGSTYTPIVTTTLASNGSLSFTSIPSTYTDLILIAACEGSYGVSTYDQVQMKINNDSGSNYSSTSLGANSSTPSSGRQTSTTFIGTTTNSAPSFDGKTSPIIMQFMNYANTTTYKTVLIRNGYVGNAAGDGIGVTVGLWRSTSAINRIDMTVASSGGVNFLAGSTFTLYGVLNA